ncbi:MAG: hypothetical protein MI740_10410 [Halanaerobiales bacterium]|nr:hypothetical protein [Halanaerobiales bacterium]
MGDEYKIKFTVVLEVETSFSDEITADGVLLCLEQDFNEMQCWDLWDSKITKFKCEKSEEEE